MPKTTIKPVLQYHSNTSNLFQVLIRIYHHQKKAYVTTPLEVQKKQFNAKTGKVIKHPKSQKYNDYLDKSIYDGQEAVLNARLEGRVLSIQELKNVVSGQSVESTQDFIEYARQYVNDHYDTVENYNRIKTLNYAIAKLEEFQGGPLQIHDINNTYVKQFQNWLSDHLGPKSVNNIINTFSQVVTHVRHNNKVNYNDNPFINLKSLKPDPRKEKKKMHLRAVDLEKLENYSGKYYRELARDAFMIMYYLGGARCSEAISLTNRQYLIDRYYFQEKSDKRIPIIMHPKLDTIISKYLNPDRMDDYILPYMKGYQRNNAEYFRKLTSVANNINNQLEKIEKEVGIKIHLTTNCARHTAVNNANKLAGREKAALLAGHADIGITEAYLEDTEKRSEIVKLLFSA